MQEGFQSGILLSMIRSWRVIGVAAAVLLFTTVAVVFPAPKAAAAEAAISLTTSPVTLDLVIKPGESTTKDLQLKNNSKVPVEINMKLQVFAADGDEGLAVITDPKPGDPSASWVHFSPSTFTAQPGVFNTVKMTIDLPKEASLGYYYVVVFQPVIQSQTKPGTNTVKGSNAILVLVDTQSGTERQIEVADFSVSKKVYEYLPTTFTVNIHNGGNIYLAPIGNIFIGRDRDITKTIAALDVNSAGSNVLPHSNRNFKVKWSDGFPVHKDKIVNGQPVADKSGKVIQKLEWNTSSSFSKIRFGKYYARLTLVYNNGKRVVPLTGIVSFWVIPWKFILVGLVILLLIGFALWMIIRRGIVRRIIKLRKGKGGQRGTTAA